MSKLNKELNELENKYVSVEKLNEEELLDTYGGGDSRIVIMYGIFPPIETMSDTDVM